MDQLREALAAITRVPPTFRGLGRFYRFANDAFLSGGASPIGLTKMHDGTRMRVDLRTWTEVEPYYRGAYDPDTLSMCKSLFNPSDYFIDVGGHVGFYTVAISNYIRGEQGAGSVLSFEPHPKNISRLRSNVRLNGLEEICESFEIALSDEMAQVPLVMREDFKHGGETGNCSIASVSEMDEGFQTIEVETEPLDHFTENRMSSATKIDFIKVDAEGHELHFLRGAESTIRNHKPKILLEINKPFYSARGVDLSEELDDLIPEFYNFFHLSNGDLQEKDNAGQFGEVDNAFLLPNE